MIIIIITIIIAITIITKAIVTMPTAVLMIAITAIRVEVKNVKITLIYEILKISQTWIIKEYMCSFLGTAL